MSSEAELNPQGAKHLCPKKVVHENRPKKHRYQKACVNLCSGGALTTFFENLRMDGHPGFLPSERLGWAFMLSQPLSEPGDALKVTKKGMSQIRNVYFYKDTKSFNAKETFGRGALIPTIQLIWDLDSKPL
ncbi:MAG: hypothetical protein HFE44_06205 [Oscillospiraceae bacterium]|nr:hypothetical protein [Oscillospiraceae bacterium]